MHTEFPLPSIPLPAPLPPTIDPEVVASTPPAALTSDQTEHKDEDLLDADDSENQPPPNSQSSTKENDAPRDIAASRPPVPPFDFSQSQQNAVQPPDSVDMQSGTLPPDLLMLYTTSTHILERDFAQSPPYTIQRLAELVLYPKNHYRFLPAYLRALDRIVSVSSPVSDFPLPTLHASGQGGFLTNGDSSHVNGSAEREGLGLGSDESLGGALLTPIPWLRNNALTSVSSNTSQSDGELHSESTETIEGPNGAGSIETVTVTVNGVPSATSVAHTSPAQTPLSAPTSPTLSEQSDASSSSSSGTTEAQLREQGAVTQGELLRQEQEAGVIPLTQTSPRRSLIAGGAVAVGREPAITGMPASGPDVADDRPEEHPHARGPEEIGMEDMGPQHHPLEAGLDMEAAVGRGRDKSPQPSSATLSPDTIPAPEADAEADAAAEDLSGQPGKDPQDVEMEVEKLREAMDIEKENEAKAEDSDVVLADADGRDVEESEKMEITGDLSGADAADTTTL